MADIRSSELQKNNQKWAEENRKLAGKLLLDVNSIRNELFNNGNLEPFLRILSKMPYQNSYNLLILMSKLPEAVCLAGFGTWHTMHNNPMLPVLKKGQKGRGVPLLVPFTDKTERAVTWYAATYFDSSQVNVNYTVPRLFNSEQDNHISYLISSIQAILSYNFKMSVKTSEDEDDIERLKKAGAAGLMTEDSIILFPELPNEEKLRFLGITLCRLCLQSRDCEKKYENYLAICASHSLFAICQVPALSYLSPNPGLIRSVPEELRPIILSLIQSSVHTLSNMVCEHYERMVSLDKEIPSNISTDL